MTFSLVFEQLLNGLQFGVTLFLMAAGLTLVLGIMNFINLAHGSFYMVGAYLALLAAQWTGSYLLGLGLGLAGTLLVCGRLGDLIGHRTMFAWGAVVYALASALAGLLPSFPMLLAGRALQGVGAAMIMPVTLSVITSSFPAEQRARAVGIWSGFAGAGGILGLFVSSFLIDQFTWPWLFVMPIVFSVISLVMTLQAVSNSREHQEGRFDTIGSLLSAIAIGGLVLGIHEGPEKGWSHSLTLTGLVVAYGYGIEIFTAWYSANEYEMYMIANRALGPYRFHWYALILCNVLAPQFFWFKRLRTSIPFMFVISIIINIGMWFERFVIIATSLHRDFLPSSWGYFVPTWVDILTFLGTFGLFFTLFLLFMRFLPMIAISEVKGVTPYADPHMPEGGAKGGHH